MSQTNDSKDSQVLLQSMLQRLKLQPGRERPGFLDGQNASGTDHADEDHYLVTNGNGSPAQTLGFSGQRLDEGGESWRPDNGKVISFRGGEDAPVGRIAPPFPDKPQDRAVTSGYNFESRPGTTEATAPSPHQGYKPRVYDWTPKTPELDAQSGRYRTLPENQFTGVETNQENVSTSRRKQRSSEVKPRRWTQRIKERWRDRKDKDQHHLPTTGSPVSVSTAAEGTTLVSQRRSETAESPKPPDKDSGDEHSSSDFDIGLGSFSLLDEIITGQEWAKFLNPAESPSTVHQDPPRPQDMNSETPVHGPGSQSGPGISSWSYDGGDLTPRRPSIMADTFLPVSMETLEGGPAPGQDPMEQSQVHQIYNKSRARRQPRVLSYVERADFLESSSSRRQSYLNRKRHHQAVNEELHRGMNYGGKEGGSTVFLTENPTSSAPSFPSFSGPVPRGVLKHSISRDSNSPMETSTKRRRLEDNRRVHFSEEVMTIMPAEPYPDLTDSEEDSVFEEDSVPEEDSVLEEDEEEKRPPESQRAAMDEATPSRRAALPLWMKALRRKNTGRKQQ